MAISSVGGSLTRTPSTSYREPPPSWSSACSSRRPVVRTAGLCLRWERTWCGNGHRRAAGAALRGDGQRAGDCSRTAPAGWREGARVAGWRQQPEASPPEACGRAEPAASMDPGGALWWVDGTPGGPVVAVGDGGSVQWLRGSPADPPGPPTQADLYGVEVLPDGSLHVVGATADGRGEAWRWTETRGWEPVFSNLDGVLFKVQDGWIAAVDVGPVGPGVSWSNPSLTPRDWRGVVAQSTERAAPDGRARGWTGTGGPRLQMTSRHWTVQGWGRASRAWLRNRRAPVGRDGRRPSRFPLNRRYVGDSAFAMAQTCMASFWWSRVDPSSWAGTS